MRALAFARVLVAASASWDAGNATAPSLCPHVMFSPPTAATALRAARYALRAPRATSLDDRARRRIVAAQHGPAGGGGVGLCEGELELGGGDSEGVAGRGGGRVERPARGVAGAVVGGAQV